MSTKQSTSKQESLPLVLVEEISWRQAHKFFNVDVISKDTEKTLTTLTK